MKNLGLFSLLLLATLFLGTAFKPVAEAKINWMTIEQAAEASKKKPRKVIVDVYTDWCGWCKRMDKDTFDNPEVAKYVNENFYAVKFNAEGADNVIFRDKVYKFNPGYKSHDLAVEWLGGQMGYPTIVYLDEKHNKIAAVPGYFKADQMTKLLRYMKDEQYKKNVKLQDYLEKN